MTRLFISTTMAQRSPGHESSLFRDQAFRKETHFLYIYIVCVPSFYELESKCVRKSLIILTFYGINIITLSSMYIKSILMMNENYDILEIPFWWFLIHQSILLCSFLFVMSSDFDYVLLFSCMQYRVVRLVNCCFFICLFFVIRKITRTSSP